MKKICIHCGAEIELTDVEPEMSHVKCPHCGGYLMSEIEHQALCYAEKIGVYEYAVNEDGWMEYWSYFSGEGYRFIRHNLNDGEERRDVLIPDDLPTPMFLKEFKNGRWVTFYNYNCG